MIDCSLFEHLKREISVKCNINKEVLRFLKVTSGEKRGIITLFLFEGKNKTPSFFAKVSNRTNSKRFIQHEYKALEKLVEFSDIVPKPVSFFVHEPFYVSVTTFIQGRCLSDLRSGIKPITSSLLARDLDEINKTLFNLKTGYGSDKSIRLVRLLDDVKERYKAVFGQDSQLIQDLKKLDKHYVDLIHGEVDLYFNHGDLAIGHLIINSTGIKGIVDWEYFGKIRLPFFDIFYCYIVYYLVLINPSMNYSEIDETDALFIDLYGDIKATMGQYLKRYILMYNISSELVYLFFFYSLAELFLRIKTIIGISEDDTRVKFLKCFFAINIKYFVDVIQPQQEKTLAANS